MGLLTTNQIERLRRKHAGGSLSAADFIRILDSRVAPGAQPDARLLVRRLTADGDKDTKTGYRVYAAADPHHKTPDCEPHLTVVFEDRGYHLTIDRRQVVYLITDRDKRPLSGIPGWVPPGTEPPAPRSRS